MRKKSKHSDLVIFVILISMIILGVHQVITVRSFGIYPNGKCAYEEVDIGKTACPEVLPRNKSTHKVSPNWAHSTKR
jgi:hypothetical protein